VKDGNIMQRLAIHGCWPSSSLERAKAANSDGNRTRLEPGSATTRDLDRATGSTCGCKTDGSESLVSRSLRLIAKVKNFVRIPRKIRFLKKAGFPDLSGRNF
jgi:hypothetical protein